MDCSSRESRYPLFSTRASPCPPRTIYVDIYMMNPATTSHHFSSPHTCPPCAPSAIPHLGHLNRCAAFCGVQPSHTHQGSADFPIPHCHYGCGPLPPPCRPALSLLSMTTSDVPALWGTEYSRYKHVVRTRGNMLVTNIFLSQEIIGKYGKNLASGRKGCGRK